MPDPRVAKMAQVLVRYSLDLQPGEEFFLNTSPLAQELNLEIYREALLTGAHVLVVQDLPGSQEAFYNYASDAQLDYISPVDKLLVERFTASLRIMAPYNTRELSGVDPARQGRRQKAGTEIAAKFMERAGRGELKWSITLFPTNAAAQEADMGLSEYQDFVYSACLLDQPDPVAAWKEKAEGQTRLVEWLADKEQAVLKGSNIDLSLSFRGRPFFASQGKENFPDGEIFTSPVEDSVNGWVRFSYPGIFQGREIEDIELWFEDGLVVKEKASKGEELLTELLNIDAGARRLGEWGIGTNYGIQRFTKNMLFDEKMGGTIHLAVGRGFPETLSDNKSAIHWDMLCDMSDSEISVDGELFYKDGRFVI
jgi:aminopeptidase